MGNFNRQVNAKNAQRISIYYPEKRPGFVAWVNAFDYGNGKIGLSFKETLQRPNRAFETPLLELAEAASVNVSYCSVLCSMKEQESYRVYMESSDGGLTFTETGRCLEREGCFCNVGCPDGTILGFETPSSYTNELSGSSCIEARESRDGGKTWRVLSRVLNGNSINLWRARRLRNGTIILLASFLSIPWGKGSERVTRNTTLPDENYLSQTRTFFLTTQDGIHFTGPHYILQGSGAQEYDFAELDDGRLLFLANDCQGSLAVRQLVHFDEDGYVIDGSVYPIHNGAPQDPVNNPQGGFVPESIALLPNGALVGSRRHKPYSYSVDLGKNWFTIDNLPNSLYQPFMLPLGNGSVINFGHFGGDIAFGQADMFIGADIFSLGDDLPSSCNLQIERCLAEDKSHYENRFRARLTCAGKALANQEILFRVAPCWNEHGSYSQAAPESSPIQKKVVTNEDGFAEVSLPEYDQIGDIHFSYGIDAAFLPSPDSLYVPCSSSRMFVTALRPYRKCRYPYDAYLAEGTLYLSPRALELFPNAIEMLQPFCRRESDILPGDALPQKLIDLLVNNHVLKKTDGVLRWIPSIHAPYPLADVKPMSDGDWYI